MRILSLFLAFFTLPVIVVAQGSITTFDQLYTSFFEDVRGFKENTSKNTDANFEAIEKKLQRLATYTCPESFYTQMVHVSILANNRPKAIFYLKECFRYGGHLNYYKLDTEEDSPIKFLSELTLDSLWQDVGSERCPAFNWQKQMEIKDIIDARQSIVGVAWADSNANKLAQPLRTFMYSYLRHNPFPADCETGIGSNAQCRLLIAQYSRFLHDFEFKELHKFLLDAMRSFALPRSFVVSVVDRYYAQKEESFYGTNVDYFGETPSRYINLNKAQINANRLQIGLGPI